MKKFIVKIFNFFSRFNRSYLAFKITKFPTAKIGALIETYFRHIYLTEQKKNFIYTYKKSFK